MSKSKPISYQQQAPLQNGEITIENVGLFSMILVEGTNPQCDITPIIGTINGKEYVDETQTISLGNGANYGYVIIEKVKIANVSGTGTIGIFTWSA